MCVCVWFIVVVLFKRSPLSLSLSLYLSFFSLFLALSLAFASSHTHTVYGWGCVCYRWYLYLVDSDRTRPTYSTIKSAAQCFSAGLFNQFWMGAGWWKWSRMRGQEKMPKIDEHHIDKYRYCKTLQRHRSAYFFFILSNRDQQLIRNNPYSINLIGCLLVFNNLFLNW